MKFEYDPEKSKKNLEKHGIDFEEAKELWHDVDMVVIPSVYEAEERTLLIGMLNQRVWVAIFTLRKDKIRIISVRRARDN